MDTVGEEIVGAAGAERFEAPSAEVEGISDFFKDD